MPWNKEEHDRLSLGLIRQRRMTAKGCRRIFAACRSLSTLACWALSPQLLFSSIQFSYRRLTQSLSPMTGPGKQFPEALGWQVPDRSGLGVPASRKFLDYSSHKGWVRLHFFFSSQLRNRKECSIVACPGVMHTVLSWLVFLRTMEINLM